MTGPFNACQVAESQTCGESMANSAPHLSLHTVSYFSGYTPRIIALWPHRLSLSSDSRPRLDPKLDIGHIGTTCQGFLPFQNSRRSEGITLRESIWLASLWLPSLFVRDLALNPPLEPDITRYDFIEAFAEHVLHVRTLGFGWLVGGLWVA